MSSLTSGARSRPLHHITIRVPEHDGKVTVEERAEGRNRDCEAPTVGLGAEGRAYRAANENRSVISPISKLLERSVNIVTISSIIRHA